MRNKRKYFFAIISANLHHQFAFTIKKIVGDVPNMFLSIYNVHVFSFASVYSTIIPI